MEHTTSTSQVRDSKMISPQSLIRSAVVFSRFKIKEILVGHGVPSDNCFWHTARGWAEIHLLADPTKEEGSPWATALCCSCPPYHQPVTRFPVLQQHPVLNLHHGIQTKRAAHSRYICPSHIFSTFLSMDIQLLIIFANQNLHLNTKNNTRSFLCLLFSPSPSVLSHLPTQHTKSSLSPRIAQRTTAFACC